MTLLNRPSNGHVSSMIATWRSLRRFGPMSRDDLHTLCAPRGEVSDAARTILPGTIATWTALGMFVQENSIALTPAFAGIDLDDVELLRTRTLACLLRPENSPSLVDADAEEGASMASDFVRVASWSLGQDPYKLPAYKQAEVLSRAPTLFRGDGRWNSFQEWAYFTGLGAQTARGLVMCPARAMRATIADLAGPFQGFVDEDLLVSDFLAKLASSIPVLDGGTYRSRVEEAYPLSNTVPPISQSVSLALLQLDHEDVITLDDRPGDVARRYTLIGRNRRPLRSCSHVRVRSVQ